MLVALVVHKAPAPAAAVVGACRQQVASHLGRNYAAGAAVVATAVEVALGSLHLGQLRGMTQQQRMELSHHHTRYKADTLLVLLLLVDLWGQAGIGRQL
jgi:hypothetical protein